MPELPEVETVVRELRGPLVGRRITSVSCGRKPLRVPFARGWSKDLVGRCVHGIERRGKWILVDLEGPMLVVHLGMTGQFTVVPADIPRRPHTHIVFGLDDGTDELRFRDVRRFGSVCLYPDRAAVAARLAAQKLGPEPFDVAPDYWRHAVTRANRCLKAILLDQRVLAGVGNIYADESLFESRLHPATLGVDMKPRHLERLRQAIVAVLEKAITFRGSSIRDYIGGSGKKGGFQKEFRVYGRTGEPCLNCGVPIVVTRMAGRSTHFCPRCQKRP